MAPSYLSLQVLCEATLRLRRTEEATVMVQGSITHGARRTIYVNTMIGQVRPHRDVGCRPALGY